MMMKNKNWLILLIFMMMLLLGYSGSATSGYFSNGESSTDNILRIKVAPLFGKADSFAVLAYAGITNTGTTAITGDVGSSPTATETGFGTVTLTGTDHAGDAVTQAAKTDLTTAYNDAVARAPVTTVPTELGGTTRTPGVYDSASGTFGITGTLTLDAGGNPDAVFIFKMASTLITAANSHVDLGDAKAANVYWVVGSSATLGADSTFKGNIMAYASITMNTGAVLEGRALAQTGAVTLDTNTVTKPAP